MTGVLDEVRDGRLHQVGAVVVERVAHSDGEENRQPVQSTKKDMRLGKRVAENPRLSESADEM